jgi:PAS domain S-box-containing protein
MERAQRVDTHMDNGLALVVAVVIMAAVFVLDVFTPLGFTVWVGYILPIWYLSRFSLDGAVLPSVTLTCTALIVVGYLLSPPGISLIIDAGNRMMGAVLFWIMTIGLIRTHAADERVRVAQRNLQESDEFNRSLMEGTADCVTVLDLNGRLLLMNAPGMRQMEIDDFSLFCGKDWWALWPQEACETVRRSVERARAGETNSFEAFCPTVKGTPKWWEVTVSPVRAIQGDSVVRLLSVSHEMTDRKQAEEWLLDRDRALTVANETLKKQTEALAEANKELEGFSYSVSHDLRAPLRTIDAFSRIVEEESGPQLNTEAQRCLQLVRKAAGQAGELIDDLLEFSRLGRQGMDVRSVQMTELVREAAHELRTVKEGRKIHLILADLPPCLGDHRLLKLVWINLLSNAFKYTKNREEAQIEIGWMPDDRGPDTHIYSIKDNGVGFDMKYVHKLFAVFQRLHRQEDFEGTGVGLAIVQRIVHRHGGRVWAEGKIDGGATFYFSLRKATLL